jgi:hypothetical protein
MTEDADLGGHEGASQAWPIGLNVTRSPETRGKLPRTWFPADAGGAVEKVTELLSVSASRSAYG